MFVFGIEGRETASLFKCLFPSSVFIIFPIATLTVLCISLYSLFLWKGERERSKDLMLIVTAIIGLASWHQYFPVPCFRHCYWAAIPMLGFYAFVIQRFVSFSFDKTPVRLSRHWINPLKLLLVVALLLPFSGKVNRMATDATSKLASIPDSLVFHDSPLKYMFITNTGYQFFYDIRSVIDRIPREFTERPGLNLADFGIYALYFPNGNNLFPMYLNWGNQVYPNYFEQVSAALVEKRPMVIIDKELKFPGYRLFAVIKNMKPPLFFYLPSANQNADGGGLKTDGTEVRK